MFDTAEITVKAGDGGNGLSSFRREKYKPKGGPWGGDGGAGGDIIFEVDPHLNTLLPFHRKRIYKADKGKPGMTNLKKGKDGEDLTVKVPLGTIIKAEDNAEVIKDMTNLDDKIKLQNGGRGGLGNWHFKSSTNQAPTKATPGQQIDPLKLQLELKLIADVGLIGLPSSGKSTLLNALTRSNVKTAEYHFTTLEPNLGVLDVSNYLPTSNQTLVLADIPGLIEGASEGKGLGHEFLRHIERTKTLVHILDGAEMLQDKKNPRPLIENYNTIQNELKNWNPELLNKPQILVVNKIDLFGNEADDVKQNVTNAFKDILNSQTKLIFISAAAYLNLDDLVKEVLESHNIEAVREKERQEKAESETPAKKKIFNIENLPNRRIIFKD